MRRTRPSRTTEAGRPPAPRDPLPVLGTTKHVTILSATDDRPMDELMLRDLQHFLGQHALNVSTKLFARDRRLPILMSDCLRQIKGALPEEGTVPIQQEASAARDGVLVL